MRSRVRPFEFVLVLLLFAGLGSACGDPECPDGQIFSEAEDRCVPEDPGITDADMDGVAAEDDCDDTDASLGATAADMDCDGILTAMDCDDMDDMVGSSAGDMDCDGVPTAMDCDDMDDMVGSSAMDMDCDGVPTAMDCDDMDDMVGSSAMDMDCDGVPTAMDCDDEDDMVGSSAMDMDCDGVPTAMDCDDMDAMVGSNAMDMDCDGVPTAMDCDDMDAMVGSNAMDMDCDGVPTAMDCDDMDEMLGAIAEDLDCDGVANADDECPNDPEFTVAPPPEINVRFPAQVSATNASGLSFSGNVFTFCDATLVTFTAANGADPLVVDVVQNAPDESFWTFTSSLTPDQVNTISLGATDSNGLMGSGTLVVEQFQPPQTQLRVSLSGAQGIAFNPTTNRAYISDEGIPGVVELNLTNGTSRVFSGPGVGTGDPFTSDLEGGITYDGSNGRLLVTDDGADAVIAVDLATGNRSILSGPANSGPALDTIYGIVADSTGGVAYLVDSGLDGVVSVNLTTGDRAIVSSDGVVGTGPDLTTPRDVELDLANNRLLVVGTGADALVAVDLASGDRSELSGPTVGMGVAFSSIRGVTLDAANNRALIAEAGNGFEGVVAVDLTNGNRTELSGPNVGTTVSAGADFDSARGILIDAANNRLVVVDQVLTSAVAVNLTNGDRTFIEPIASPFPDVGMGPGLVDPTGMAFDPTGPALYVADDGANAIYSIDLTNGDRNVVHDSTSMGTVVDEPRGLGLDVANQVLLVPDNASSLDAILGIDIATGAGSIISDDDSPDETSETFASPRGRVALEPGGTTVLVADTSRDSVFRVVLATGERTTLAEAGDAELEGVQTVDIDAANNRALITVASTGDDSVLDALLALDLMTGERTVLASRSTDTPAVGTGVDMTNPRGLAFDGRNNRALVFDSDLDAVLGVDLASGDRTIISSASVGRGDLLSVEGNNTNALELVGERDIVYVVNENVGQVIMVDLVTGDQVIISR